MTNTENLSPLEIKALAIIVQARELADTLEGMLVEIMESRMDKEVKEEPKAKKVTKKKKTSEFSVHPNIVALTSGSGYVEWDRTTQSITELRNYAFVTCRGKADGNVAFSYTTAKFPKVNMMNKMTQEVFDAFEKDKTYVVHTTKKNGKNFWDHIITLDMSEKDAWRRGRTIAAFFAELKLHNII